MDKFRPEHLTTQQQPQPSLATVPAEPWLAVLSHRCLFAVDIFDRVMLNLIQNPNINSSYIFRADVLNEHLHDAHVQEEAGVTSSTNVAHVFHNHVDQPLKEMDVDGFVRQRSILRRLIPRNPQLDAPLLQTCLFYASRQVSPLDSLKHLVIYLPHVSSAASIPHYHPSVRALAFLYSETSEITRVETVPSISLSIHVVPFEPHEALSDRTSRTCLHLLQTVYKHGCGLAAGYVKRVHHDLIVPRSKYQDTYTRLKRDHAKRLINNWVEKTDPGKHVFEDLGIAAWLIEVWQDMYGGEAHNVVESARKRFPGFVDIGCGNGVLVDVLVREGWDGWGFDARARKTWLTFEPDVQRRLKTMVLVPDPLRRGADVAASTATASQAEDGAAVSETQPHNIRVHNGVFPSSTFIISNHADELTGWTPLLAALSDSPFLIIPCCSHDLSGARSRASAKHALVFDPPAKAAPGPKSKASHPSAYASLVGWVGDIAMSLGFDVQKEMLRIPSTRNTALFSSHREQGTKSVSDILEREGGGSGWTERAMALTRATARGH
ncbi:MAG: tRNA(Ser) Um(44) 2'-O-methyltransferase [Caeruleum heppii]|nr:MAG: tRNA(Ser) Um(44) 2'-O-methyltransferase [Caeruleum heppii]